MKIIRSARMWFANLDKPKKTLVLMTLLYIISPFDALPFSPLDDILVTALTLLVTGKGESKSAKE